MSTFGPQTLVLITYLMSDKVAGGNADLDAAVLGQATAASDRYKLLSFVRSFVRRLYWIGSRGGRLGEWLTWLPGLASSTLPLPLSLTLLDCTALAIDVEIKIATSQQKISTAAARGTHNCPLYWLLLPPRPCAPSTKHLWGPTGCTRPRVNVHWAHVAGKFGMISVGKLGSIFGKKEKKRPERGGREEGKEETRRGRAKQKGGFAVFVRSVGTFPVALNQPTPTKSSSTVHSSPCGWTSRALLNSLRPSCPVALVAHRFETQISPLSY